MFTIRKLVVLSLIVMGGSIGLLALRDGGLAAWIPTFPVFQDRKEVLSGADTPNILSATSSDNLRLNVQVESEFARDAVFLSDVRIDGRLEAPNLLYGLIAGTGMSVSDGQTPTITNTDLGSAQAIFKTITVGSSTITADSNTDTLTLKAGDLVNLSTSGKEITIGTSADNYASWSFAVDGTTKDSVTAGDILDFVSGTSIDITRSDDDKLTFGLNTTEGLTVGASGQFVIDSSGNITKLNNIDYSFPSAQGAASSVLMNDGVGALSWGTFGAASVTPDSLDFAQFVDAMTVDADTTIDLYNSGATDLRFYNSNASSELLFLDSSTGRIGIGTTAPAYKLDVAGTMRVDNPITFDITAPDGTKNNIILTSTGFPIGTPPGQGKSILIGGNIAEGGGDFGVVNIGGNSAGGGNSYFNVIVGYGSSAVSQPGIVAVGKSATATGPNAVAIGRDTSVGSHSIAIGYNAKATGTSSASFGAGTVSANSLYAYGGSSTSHFFAGNVGIGTTSPAYKLHVAGDTLAGGIYLNNSDIGLASDADLLSLADNALTVNGALTATGAISGASLTDGTTTFADTAWTSTSGVAWDLANSSTTALNIESGLLNLDTQNGRVGIGTTSPGTNLHIKGTIANDVTTPVEMLRIDLSDDNNGNLFAGGGPAINFYVPEDTANQLGAQITATRESDVDVNAATALAFWTAADDAAPTEKMRVTSIGNVGIGTTVPLSKLVVLGNLSVGETYGAVAAPTSGAIIEGNVGIGTMGPGAKLQINPTSPGGTGYANIGKELQIQSTTPNITFNDTSASVDDYAIYLNQSEFTLGRYTSDTSMTPDLVLKSGNVGIGTTAPGYKLDVNGDINTTGDIRKNGTAYTNPDYVFEPDYELMPLADLEIFVAENKHLPGVPSSEDILRDGVKLFEQTRLNLEKTEEAYLYLFDLDDRVSGLSLSLPSITSDLSSLKGQEGKQTLGVTTTAPQDGLQLDEQTSQEIARLLEGLEIDTETGAWEVKQETRFIDRLIAGAQALFEKAVTFLAEVTFGDRVTFADKDMGGFAIIKTGADEVEVVFEKPYAQTPIVTVTLATDDETAEDHILGADLAWNITNRSPNGFTIKLNTAAPVDTQFSWTALAITDARTTESEDTSDIPDSAGSAPNNQADVNVTPIQTEEPTETASSSAFIELTPTNAPADELNSHDEPTVATGSAN